MQDVIMVKKRGGQLEPLNLDKINMVVSWATEGVKDVNPLDIVVNAKLNISSGITTRSIQQVLIESAANLIDENNPNYQIVASRLTNYHIRKDIWGSATPPKLEDIAKKNIKLGVYDDKILESYDAQELDLLDTFIDHGRDFDLSYAGIRQLCDKYLVQNRETKELYETPQFAYMLISMIAFSRYPKDQRLAYVKKAYDCFSKQKINLPTPLLAGVRTTLKSYASCALFNVDDTMNSITANIAGVMKAVSNRYGIGLNVGRIRPIGSTVRNGETLHTGVVPFLKTFEAAVRSCHQNGIRGGSATVNFPIWHGEVEDIIVLKNNGGTEDNRARKLDYVIQFSKLFYQRFLNNEDITLFSPKEVPELYDAFGTDEFDELYERAEKSPKIKRKKKVSMRSLMSLLVKERTETGRIYVMNIDHCNSHSSWDTKIEMTNLCVTEETRLATQYGILKAKDLYLMGKELNEDLKVAVDKRTIDGTKGVEILPATKMYCTANMQPIYKVTTDKGYTIRATKSHDLYVLNPTRTSNSRDYIIEKKPISSISVGDRLLVQSDIGQFGPDGSEEMGFLVGLVTGDGTFSEQCNKTQAIINIHNEELDIIDDVIKAKDSWILMHPDIANNGRPYVRGKLPKLVNISNSHSKYTIQSRKLYQTFERYGISKDMKFNVPEIIFSGTQDCISGYLRGLFMADGCVVDSYSKPHLQLVSINKSLLEDVQILLSNFGIMSNINSLPDRQNPSFSYTTINGQNNSYYSKPTFRLDITGEHVKQFDTYIGLLGKKKIKLQNLLNKVTSWNKDTFVKVVSIDFDGYEDVYDVTQSKNNSVIFNGLVSGQCVEITHPTVPMQSMEDPDAMIGICTLGAINVLNVRDIKDIESTCDITVRLLEELMNMQDYFLPAAEKFVKEYRSLGIGLINLAAFMAKNGVRYTDDDAPNFVDELVEKIQFFLLKASNNLAKERGPAPRFHETKYSRGVLPIDTYKKEVDAIVTRAPALNWESLREDIVKYGLRHCSLTAQMPCESSSLVFNATNGMEPPRAYLTYKTSKASSIPVLLPEHKKWNYTLAFEMGNNEGLINVVAAIQKWFDMATSTNLYYRYADYEDGKLPDMQVVKDILYAYKMGVKTLYYSNTSDVVEKQEYQACEGGACSI